MDNKFVDESKKVIKDLLYGFGNLLGKSFEEVVVGFNDGRKGKNKNKRNKREENKK